MNKKTPANRPQKEEGQPGRLYVAGFCIYKLYTMKTKVKFLLEKNNERGVYALFIDEKYVHDLPKLLISYSIIGQHTPCHIEYANQCTPAMPEQYAALKKELETIGYELDIINQ